MKRMIGILAGGDSPEREVSLLSGRGVFDALQRREHSVRLVEIDTLDDLVPGLKGIDVAFNCLHGGSGEDGTVRMLLDVMGIPSIGSGPLACSRAMDKAQAKTIFQSKDIPTPAGVSLDAESIEAKIREAVDTLTLPMILKPQNGGSTISVLRVEAEADLLPAAQSILSEFNSVLIEPFISGRELTVGILQIEGVEIALPVIEIRFPGDLFDYAAKYTDGEAEFLAPAPLSPDVAERVQSFSLQAHQTLDCYGFSRVDLRLGEDGVPYVLEVNALPGMTPISDLPRAAAAHGIGYDDLVEIMLATAEKAID
ncbi:D-alanine--D-alanine ligase [Candidatus Bipolaricaulota bacterium]|nr:D-alanine--D-alanine ligase [Candidatus Bipolaricaulota bacterium]